MADNFDKNIFINCPFDEKYKNDLLNPILYLIVKNGYTPKIASEDADSAECKILLNSAIIASSSSRPYLT
ncbi:hypothetical protein GCM10027566_03040 [Arachidicoccus ginsenosidivorans]